MTGSATPTAFGMLTDGRTIEKIRLAAGDLAAEILTFGGILHRLEVPDRSGVAGNIVLALPDLETYRDRNRYLGAITGRYANRIAGGRFTLDGREYELATNQSPHHLHGGRVGFDKKVWRAVTAETAEAASVTLEARSPDGEEGYPGTLDVRVRYTLERNALRIDYRAVTDAPTIVNLTNHAYFDLSAGGAPDISDHLLELRAARYLPTDPTSIPTGEAQPVSGTPFDFTRPARIGDRLADPHPQVARSRGIDHCYVLDAPGLERPFVRLVDPRSGRVLEAVTTEPGVQLYTGQFLDGTLSGPDGRSYGPYAGLCLETQHFPDSPNRPDFPTTVLRPDDAFTSTTILRFEVA